MGLEISFCLQASLLTQAGASRKGGDALPFLEKFDSSSEGDLRSKALSRRLTAQRGSDGNSNNVKFIRRLDE